MLREEELYGCTQGRVRILFYKLKDLFMIDSIGFTYRSAHAATPSHLFSGGCGTSQFYPSRDGAACLAAGAFSTDPPA